MNKQIGAILLVSGTTIGAGMLALPVTTGLAGFFPSLLLMTFLWLYMLLTAFYLLEVNLRMKGESNLISMVKKTLGKGGEIVAWVCYLALLYALVAAYMVGCSQILNDLFTPSPLWPILIFLFFGTFVYLGTRIVDSLNRVLMAGLALSYALLIALGIAHVDVSLLLHQNFGHLAGALAVMLTSFGYHIIIPTLTTYLEHDTRQLKRAIFIGSLLPFLVYLLWQFLAMGVIPVEGEPSLTSAQAQGLQATLCLKEIVNCPYVTLAARGFAFFAIVTSLLGVSLSLSDFLADGLKIKRTHIGILLLTFLPPLLFALFYPQGFILALQYAGVFVVILLMLLPTLMAISERKKQKGFLKASFTVPGGTPLLGLSVCLSLILLLLVVFL